MFPYSCRPPIPRPEPFSPLPWRGADPDWGKWIRDRLAEKGALLAFPARAAFPAAGDSPSLYLAEDTGVLYRWNGAGYAVLVDPSSDVETYPGRSAFPDAGRSGVIYIDASANLLYRWDGTGYVLLTSDLSDVESRLTGVESKIPAQATAQNQLADKAFVNSSIATNTAFYISDEGRPFQSLADLESYEGALTNNDYAFVVGRDAAGNTTYTRYKWNEATEAWGEEYVLNNSSFTAAQWAAINSGITSGDVTKLAGIAAGAQVNVVETVKVNGTALTPENKAVDIAYDNTVTPTSANGVKSSGIWAALWGALSALPTGFTSLYDWVVSQLARKLSLSGGEMNTGAVISFGNGGMLGGATYAISGSGIKRTVASPFGNSWTKSWDDIAETSKTVPTSRTINGVPLSSDVTLTGADIAVSGADSTKISAALAGKASKADVDPLLFAQYYPEGNVKSAAEFTSGIKYDTPDTVNRTITVKPFCDTGDSANDNSSLVGRVVIPPFVDDDGNGYISDDGTRFEVVGVGSSSAFYDNTRLVAVIVPRTVATIGGYAFRDCTALTSVSLPAVQTVGDQAFARCSSLTAISLPAATNIGDYVFTDCASLTSVSLPAATTVGNAFWGCGALTSVSLPAATNIGDNAFSSCAVLTSVVLSAATNIGNAFRDCTALTSVVLPAATSFGNSTFFGCTSLASVDFGDMPRPSVPDCVPIAFDGVPTSCKLIVPDAQYDEWTAKRGWSALVRAGYTFLRHSEWEYARRYEIDPLLFAQYYPEGNVKSAAEFTPGIKYTLASNATERTATVNPFGNTGDSENNNSGLVGRVVIPPFVDAQRNPYISDDGTRYKVIGVSGGDIISSNNTNLTAIVAPSTVTEVGINAFQNCTSLSSISLPTVTSIRGDAFDSCSLLASISLPAATNIGGAAFYNCGSLVSASLPAATNIGGAAFEGCSSLASISLPAAENIGSYAFSSCTSLASISLPAATTIGGGVFSDCTSLASVSLPAVTSIGGLAFSGCTLLTSVDFGDTPRSSVPSLDTYAFYNVPTACKIIVPDAQYDAWIAATNWSTLYANGYKFLKHSEWEYARKYEVDKKADKPATFTTGNLAKLDANGNPTDAGYRFEVRNGIPYIIETTND